MGIVRLLKSRRLTEVLFVLLLVIMVVGMSLPQESGFTSPRYESWKVRYPALMSFLKAVGLTNIFSSWIFFIVLSLFFINALLCTWERLQWALRQVRKKREVSEDFVQGLRAKAQIAWKKSSSPPLGTIAKLLSAKRFRLERAENSLSAWKNQWVGLASPLFHLTLLFILLMVIWGRAVRLEGATKIVEGRAFTEAPQGYLYLSTGPLFGGEHQGFQVKLEKLYFDYKKDGLNKGKASCLLVLEDGAPVKKDTIFTNHQMNYKGFYFSQGSYGLAPFLRVMGEKGEVISEGYLMMRFAGENIYTISTSLKGTDYSLEAKLYPDLLRDGKRLKSKSESPKNPLLVLTLSEKGKKVLRTSLKPKKSASANGLAVSFDDLKGWSELDIYKDVSIPFLYWGFWAGTFLLAIMFLMTPKNIWAYVEEKEGEKKVFIGGRALRYQSLFKREFAQIVERIKQARDGER